MWTNYVTTSLACTSSTINAPINVRCNMFRSLRTIATIRVISSFMNVSYANTPFFLSRDSFNTPYVIPSVHFIKSISKMFCALNANNQFSRLNGSSSGYSFRHCFAMSYNDFIIISWIFINQCSTGPSAITLAENLTTYGIVYGSADIIEIIYRDSSTSVNSILLMLSKHFLKWAWTACGFLV